MTSGRSRGIWLSLLSLALGATAFSSARGALRGPYAALGEAEDLTALPDPEKLKVFSLGYDAAVADYLFASTLVRAGRSFTQKRHFEHLDRYLRAIIYLDPYYRDVYLFADSLLTLSTVESPPENFRHARDILEVGLAHFPNDAELWLSAGQFVLYLAPPWLGKGEDPSEWRAQGATMMQRACELTPDEPPAGCISSLRRLSEAGETEAAIASIQRMLVLAEEPSFRAALSAKLAELVSEARARTFGDRTSSLARRHLFDLPLASRAEYQIMGPAFAGFDCLSAKAPSQTCVTSFRSDRAKDALGAAE